MTEDARLDATDAAHSHDVTHSHDVAHRKPERALPTDPTTLGIVGAGKLGMTVARLARAAGLSVNISGSGAVDKIALTTRVLAPGATPMTTAEVIESSDVILLALPMSRARELDASALAGKLVIDGMNYWWETDGEDAELANPNPSSSELVAQWFPQ